MSSRRIKSSTTTNERQRERKSFYRGRYTEKEREIKSASINHRVGCEDHMDSYIAVFKESFSYLVWKARRQQGWTQEELSMRSGVDRTTIAKIEQLKRDPSLETVLRLSRALNLNLNIEEICADLKHDELELQ